MNQLWPYDLLTRAPEIATEMVLVDGLEMPKAYFNAEGRRIDVAAIRGAKWSEARVSISVSIPWEEIRARSDIGKKIRVLIRCQCDATNIRQSVLTMAEDGKSVRATLTLPRNEYSRRAVVDAFVVGDVSLAGAISENRVLGVAENWDVRFDEITPSKTPTPRGRGKTSGKRRIAEPEWINFREPPAPLKLLQEFKDEPFFLRLSADPPVLYLNEGITGYRLLVDEEIQRRREPAEAILRERELKGIATSCWTTMFAAACAAVESGEGEQQPGLPDGWRGDVILTLTPHMFPELSLQESLNKICAAREDGSGKELATIYELAQSAAAKQVESGRSLARALQRLTSKGVS